MFLLKVDAATDIMQLHNRNDFLFLIGMHNLQIKLIT